MHLELPSQTVAQLNWDRPAGGFPFRGPRLSFRAKFAFLELYLTGPQGLTVICVPTSASLGTPLHAITLTRHTDG